MSDRLRIIPIGPKEAISDGLVLDTPTGPKKEVMPDGLMIIPTGSKEAISEGLLLDIPMKAQVEISKGQ